MLTYKKMKCNIILTMIGAWSALGFKRGIDSFNYNFSKNELYQILEKKPLILDKICWGIGGCIYYIFPPFLFHGLYKEIYRLEVNVRGLENEKKTDYYNSIC